MEQQPAKMDMAKVQEINKVKYALPTNLNIVERRTNKVNFADQNAYSSTSGNEVVIRLQASTDYVYGKNSYLVFEVSGSADAPDGSVGFNKNTAMNLFDRVLYEDRSGSELCRNDKLNNYCAQVLPLHHSSECARTLIANGGQYENYDQIYDAGGIPTAGVFGKNGDVANYEIINAGGNATALTVIIPMRHILGVFNQETLIPSMLISGSLIRLQLSRATDALENIGASTVATDAGANYTLSNVRVVCDSLALTPVVQKNLMEQSQSSGGLDFVYETEYYQSGNVSAGANSFNLQINKAVSRCQKLYWSNRAVGTPSSVTKDNSGSVKFNLSQLDYRLGDLFFPQRVITLPSTAGATPEKNGAEFYENTLQSIHRMKTNVDPPAVSKNIWCTGGTALNATAGDNDNNGRTVHCQSFEMSSVLEYSGLAINNSRTLEARINFINSEVPTDPIPAQGQVIDAWICYLKLAKCNQLRAVIKE